MRKYNNPRLLNTVVAGPGMKHPTKPHVIVGDNGEFIQGDLMDANAVGELVDQKIDDSEERIIPKIDELSEQLEQEITDREAADEDLSETIDSRIQDVVGAAPEALDTLKELADALNDDANFAATVTNELTELDGRVDNNTSGISSLNTRVESLETSTPDWNENDPTSPSYIKNRTHYEETSERTLYAGDMPPAWRENGGIFLDIPLDSLMQSGEEIEMKITPGGADGPTVLRGIAGDEGMVSLKTSYPSGPSAYLYNEYQQAFGEFNLVIYGINIPQDQDAYLEIKAVNTIHVLDEKFIPATIARTEELRSGVFYNSNTSRLTNGDGVGIGTITLAGINFDAGNRNSINYLRNLNMLTGNISGVSNISGAGGAVNIGFSGYTGSGKLDMISGVLETSGVTIKSGGTLTFGDGTTMSTAPGTTDYNELINKPTKVSQFENDANYLTQHQDISGKEDVTTIVAPVNATDATLPITTLTTEIGKYYRIDVPIETLGVTLPAMTDLTTVRTVVLYLTGGTTPAITITSTAVEGGAAPNVYYQDGYEIEAGKTYEVNALFNGSAWIVDVLTIKVPFFAKLTLTDGSTVKLEGSGELTKAMVSPYSSSVVSAEIGELCTSIGFEAFSQCTGLTSVTIGSGVTYIGKSAFKGCSGLTSVTIGSGDTIIGESAFASCTSLPVVDNIRYADTYAVEAVDKTLTTYTIKEGTKWIGSNAFRDCTSLTSIDIPDSVTSIDNYAFYNCSGLTSIVIPSGVTSIGQWAFASCSGLTSIVIPDSVTTLDDAAFSRCSGLTSVTIGSGVTYIDNSAFNSCSSLTSVTIGNSVTRIGNWAFGSCSGLTSIVSNAMTAPTITDSTFLNVKRGGTLTVPSGSSGYNAWMSTRDSYLGYYNWTKVEQ